MLVRNNKTRQPKPSLHNKTAPLPRTNIQFPPVEDRSWQAVTKLMMSSHCFQKKKKKKNRQKRNEDTRGTRTLTPSAALGCCQQKLPLLLVGRQRWPQSGGPRPGRPRMPESEPGVSPCYKYPHARPRAGAEGTHWEMMDGQSGRNRSSTSQTTQTVDTRCCVTFSKYCLTLATQAQSERRWT